MFKRAYFQTKNSSGIKPGTALLQGDSANHYTNGLTAVGGYFNIIF